LENLIDLWVVEVETASDVSQTPPDSIEEQADWEPSSTKEWALVENRKIRYKCITELLKGDLFEKSGLREHIVVNMGVSRHTDHLVIPIYGTDLAVSHQVPLRPGPRDLTEKKEKHIHMHGNTGKTRVYQDLRCTLIHGRRCNPDCLGDLYWKSLLAVIKKRATPIARPVSDEKKLWTDVSLPHFTSLKFGVNKEFYREMTDIWGWGATSINPNLIGFPPKSDEELNIEDRVELLMRRQPTLDKERRLLHVKIGLVAQFPRNKLSNMLRSVFKGSSSSNIEVWNVAQVLPAFLRGMRVRRCYNPPTEVQVKQGKRGTDLWQYRKSGALEEGTVFQIVDIKWPHEVKKQIAVYGFEEPLSVPEYFEHGQSTSLSNQMLQMLIKE
jgi:predicted nucleic acid-binding OB-fold protein